MYRCKTEGTVCRCAMETRGVAIAHDETGGITGEPALVFAYPVVDTAGQMLAVVFAALDLKRLNRLEFDAEKQLPKAATLTMVDNKGVILARQPGNQTQQTSQRNLRSGAERLS
jgi:C4-dicarboxylate-specific signal transduction histidine kinase